MLYNKIVIAVDNSHHALQAAKKGFELAHQLKAAVGLVNVIDRYKEEPNTDLWFSHENSVPILLERADEIFDQIINTYGGSTEVTRFTPEGLPNEEIINTATIWNADLIVIGTHGRTGLSHLLMGSVAEHIIRHSKIPVLVVPIEEI